MADELAQEARDMAQQALSRLQGHEDVCAVRYDGINKNLTEMKRFQFWALNSVLVGLIGIISWLMSHPLH